MVRILRLAVAILLLVLPLQLLAEDAKWFKGTSDHFLLFTDTSEAKGQRLLSDFESRLTAFQGALGAVPSRQFPIEVFLFGKAEDFLDAIPGGAIDPNKSGYLIRGPDRIFVIARDKSPDVISNDVGHALGHVFFERLVIWRPFWLAEGAAEYFRKAGRDPDTKRVSAEDGNTAADLLKIVASATYQDQELPVVLNEPYREKDYGPIFRTQAYRLLRTVLESDAPALRTYLEALRTEAGGQVNLGVDKVALNDKLNQYVETRIPTGQAASEIRLDAANMGDVAIQRGDLLLAAGKTTDAAVWYKADTPQAFAARAILSRFTRTGGEAIRLLDQAGGKAPDSGLVFLHLGSIDVQTPKDLELQSTALVRAVKLLPLMGRADAQLAHIYTQTGKADLALPLLDRALALEPEFADRFYSLRADAFVELQRFDDAYATIQIAAALPHFDRDATAAYGRQVTDIAKKIDDVRQKIEVKRLEEIRSEVAAKVAVVEPPKPIVLPPPIRTGQVIYDIEATQHVEVIDSILPDFPNVLVQKGASGKITLQVGVGPDGRIAAASILSSTIPEMNAATLASVKKWTFKSVERAGRSIPFNIKLTLQYATQ